MREIVDVGLHKHPKYPFGLWLAQFDDGSKVAVDVSSAVYSHEKTEGRIKAAALRYSESHPHGVLSSVVINLSGEKIN